MAGESYKGRNLKGSYQNSINSTEQAVPFDAKSKSNDDSNAAQANGDLNLSDSIGTKSEVTDKDDASHQYPAKRDFYPVPVKTPGGKKFDLLLNPGDFVVDVRDFLLQSPETCFITCYDLLLHTNVGSVHRLEDYNEISEVADITSGSCFLEMIAELYDDLSIRAHVDHAKELLSHSTLHPSMSTILALQHEMGRTASANLGDAVKAEVPDLENLGFMENVTGSLTNLLSPPSKEIICVESIAFSSFNPPPRYRRLSGDLIYLDLVTLEGNKYCITGTTKAFYVNASTENILVPRPNKSVLEDTTLVGLLQKISPKFKEAFRDLLERKGSAEPYEYDQSLLPPKSWLGSYPVPDHKRDAARAEKSVTLSFGSELVGIQRDWNDELQSCREFPHAEHQERILRGRALYKVTSEFVDAATSGAVGVIDRCIPPINPTDPECFHMYVHNNIFFSFAVDAELEQLSRKHVSVVESTISSQNSYEKTYKSLPLGASRASNENEVGVPNMENTNGIEALSSDVLADAQLAKSEQATFASANNDLKGTKAYQEADVPGLCNLAMAIIDYRGHRVVAQSVLLGLLPGDKSDSLLYGSADNGKTIRWSEDFHSKMLEAAKRLHLKEHAVLDGSGNVVKLAAPIECKGIFGSDGRHYLLDLMRATPRDANYYGPGSRFCILRPELITRFLHDAENGGKADSEESANTEIFFNPNVFTEFKLAGSQESVLLGLLPGDKSDSLLYGSADNGKTIRWSEDFHSKMLEAAQRLHLKEHAVLDGSGNVVKLAAPIECKGILGSDGRHYLLALMRATPRDANYYGPGSRFCILRPELITRFLHLSIGVFGYRIGSHIVLGFHRMLKMVRKADSEESANTEIFFNPNELAADEENVRKASLYLTDIVLPKFILDLSTLEVLPMDGQTLTEALHSHGINVRYLGKAILRDTEDHDLGHAISHFFSCFLGKVHPVSAEGLTNSTHSKNQRKVHSGESSMGQTKSRNGGYARKKQSLYLSTTPQSLWSDIEEFAKLKYQFELPEDARQRVKKIPVIRNLCQKVGITIASRKYDFDAVAPFQVSDILDVQPVVKHSIPVCSEAKDLVETGKAQLAEGMFSEAYTLFHEAFTIILQVTGPMHREVANCCRYMAMALYRAGDMAGAIKQHHKELIINEHCLGLDHPDTARSYGNMAMIHHDWNQTELALRFMSRALLLLSLSCGFDHPDLAVTFMNVAMMYQDIGKIEPALRYLQEALKNNERLLGKEHIQTAVCYHALAITYDRMGLFNPSRQHEKKTYDIFVKHFGEDDYRTKVSQNWLITFEMNAQKQKSQTLNASSAQKDIGILLAHPATSMDRFHLRMGTSGASANKSLNSAVIGEALPRGGRGIYEQATRAAAEVCENAAARGLSLRPHGVQVQTMWPLTQLLNIINSGVTTDAANNVGTDEWKKAANLHLSNGVPNPDVNVSKPGKENQTPVA
ncbi:hypothetical protein RD792_012686 [Penstemon davidsonii]|uniref:Clu domain-containing protein n=1 Tax=Penstemon davidsonii TaxID=160366 RepID=A0ABR0CXY4_9LAMI|nr:hypothetical protein RD792_012686 [Penstemon davidsonii]